MSHTTTARAFTTVSAGMSPCINATRTRDQSGIERGSGQPATRTRIAGTPTVIATIAAERGGALQSLTGSTVHAQPPSLAGDATDGDGGRCRVDAAGEPRRWERVVDAAR